MSRGVGVGWPKHCCPMWPDWGFTSTIIECSAGFLKHSLNTTFFLSFTAQISVPDPDVVIQISILESVPLDYGSGSCSFFGDFQYVKFFCFLLTKGIFTSFFKVIKKLKTVEITVFPSFLLVDGRIRNAQKLRIRIRNTGTNEQHFYSLFGQPGLFRSYYLLKL
jgi:hypothetical protein